MVKGYKTGLYTSPHLKDFRERIKINGELVSEQFVIDFTEKIKPQIEAIEPSFFEITVAMAFEYFKTEKVDIAIIETGLGGRLDSTNIINPELSIITNIGWDHMNLLGDTLEKIATEKAGIIKEYIPVVIGEFQPVIFPVFEKIATEKNAPLTVASHQRQVVNWTWEKHELAVEVATTHYTQTKNLLTVLEACTQLHKIGWKIDESAIHTGLQNVKKMTGLHGRWEIIHSSPLVVMDVAHNPDGINQLLQQVELTNHNQLHVIIGLVQDKEVEKILALFPTSAIYYFTKAQIPRALPENELAEKAIHAKLKGHAFSEVNDALQNALQHSHKDDLILICGSVFLVGEVNTTID